MGADASNFVDFIPVAGAVNRAARGEWDRAVINIACDVIPIGVAGKGVGAGAKVAGKGVVKTGVK